MGLAPYGKNYLKNEFDKIVNSDSSGKFKLNLNILDIKKIILSLSGMTGCQFLIKYMIIK